MLETIISFLKKMIGAEQKTTKSKDAAKERLHLVLVQDRASVSADFLEAMKQEIIEVIKKYIEVDENAIDVRLTNKTNEDGTNGAPALYANIPIANVKTSNLKRDVEKKEDVKEEIKENSENEHKEEKNEQNVINEDKSELQNKEIEEAQSAENEELAKVSSDENNQNN